MAESAPSPPWNTVYPTGNEQFTRRGGSCIRNTLPGYDLAVTIPAKSVHIQINDTAGMNYLAVMTTDNEYHLNGGWIIDWSGKISAAGATFYYNRHDAVETLSALGPTREDVYVMLLSQSPNEGVHYSYNLLHEKDGLPELRWRRRPWSACSRDCGGGERRAVFECVRTSDDTVLPSPYCQSQLPVAGENDTVLRESCNTHACEPEWLASPWTDCSVSCGWGIRSRSFRCVRLVNGVPQNVEDKQCHRTPGQKSLPCRLRVECPAHWESTPWGKCKPSCGRGEQTRKAICVEDGDVVNSEACSVGEEPITKRRCEDSCDIAAWVAGSWNKCSTTCGTGVQVRLVACVRPDGSNTVDPSCFPAVKPNPVRRCYMPSC